MRCETRMDCLKCRASMRRAVRVRASCARVTFKHACSQAFAFLSDRTRRLMKRDHANLGRWAGRYCPARRRRQMGPYRSRHLLRAVGSSGNTDLRFVGLSPPFCAVVIRQCREPFVLLSFDNK